MKTKNVALAARQVKAGPDDNLSEGEFTAYASVFGNRDAYGDVVVKGAFANDLKAWSESGNPIPLLFGHVMHDPDYNLGHVTKAVEDDHGLLVTAQLDLDNPKAAQVYRMLKGKRVNQMSFAYDVLDAATVTKDGEEVFELRELKVHEVSVVTLGANQETEVLAVKTLADALTDGLKAGRVLSTKNESALREARDSIDSVLASLGDDDAKAARSGGSDQEKASGTPEATAGASANDPARGTASASANEPKASPSVDAWQSMFNTYSTAYAAEEGA